MQFVNKLLRFSTEMSADVAKVTESLGRSKGSDAVPAQVQSSRDFAWVFKDGGVPKEVLDKYRQKIGELGRAAADAWLEQQREAYRAECQRIKDVRESLRAKGFEAFVPNDTQTIVLLLRWALKNAPLSALQPDQADLDALIPRIPSDEAPPPTKAKKATKASRR